MTYKASWTISGTKLDDSAEALKRATNAALNTSNLKKYENELNQHFQDNIKNNLRRSGLNVDKFDNIFFLSIDDDIVFTNTNPLITHKYEYGYYNNNDDTIQTSPKYFIRPSIQESMNEIGNLIIQKTNQEYMNNRRQTYGNDIL